MLFKWVVVACCVSCIHIERTWPPDWLLSSELFSPAIRSSELVLSSDWGVNLIARFYAHYIIMQMLTMRSLICIRISRALSKNSARSKISVLNQLSWQRREIFFCARRGSNSKFYIRFLFGARVVFFCYVQKFINSWSNFTNSTKTSSYYRLMMYPYTWNH